MAKTSSQKMATERIAFFPDTERRPKGKNKKHPKIKKKQDPYPGPAPVPEALLHKYRRGKNLKLEGIKTLHQKIEWKKKESKVKAAVEKAARAELLLTEEKGFINAEAPEEETFRLTQDEIKASVDIQTATKIFDLDLPRFGPYRVHYSRNGRNLLLGGKLGHVAAIDWVTKKLTCEFNAMESVYDLSWLHVPTMFAVAQKNWVNVYDSQGTELHCVKELSRVLRLHFLPYHFLLVSSSERGYLTWLDVTMGKIVGECHPKCGPLPVLAQNPYNAIVLTGHSNGTVSMWAPSSKEPLVNMMCHPGHQVTGITVERQGRYMATSGMNGTLKIWDLRNYKCLHNYMLGGSATSLDFSDTGLLAVGRPQVVEVFKDLHKSSSSKRPTPYIRHPLGAYTTLCNVEFAKYEDILGIGHSQGFSSIVVPGAGEPNFDALEANPFMDKKQRQEMEVKGLLSKIQPELICLNPEELKTIDKKTLEERWEERKKNLMLKPPTKGKTHKPLSLLDAATKKPSFKGGKQKPSKRED